MLKILIFSLILFGCAIPAHATGFNKFLDSNKLIEKTPEQLMQDFKDGKINSSQLWVKVSVETKVELLDLLIKRFEEEDGVIIKKSAEFYTVLLDKIYSEQPGLMMESLKAILAAAAMREDDFYEEGLTIGQSMEKWFGQNFLINQPEEALKQGE